jgi:hypothetical protein
MSRKLHRFESREEPEQQPAPSSPSAIRASIPARNRKISTGPGLQTIEDDETGAVSDEETKKTETATSHGETEKETESES